MIVRPSEIDPAPPRAASTRPPPARVTQLLLVSIAVAWVIQIAVGADEGRDLIATLRVGANLPALVLDGEWERLVTANWLHAHWAHVAINGVGLFFLGVAMERLVGPSRFFVVYVVSCFAGAAASTAANHGLPSVGASTGLAGLFAAIGYLLFRFSDVLPAFMRRAKRQWIILLVVNLALWAVLGTIGLNIDHAGHGGGFVAGGVMTALLTWRWPPLTTRRARERAIRVVAIALLVPIAAGLGTSIWRGTTRSDAELVRALLAADHVQPMALNDYAFLTAIDEDTPSDRLPTVLLFADRALQKLEQSGAAAPEIRMVQDTVATANYRVGNFDEAVRVQREVFEGAAADEQKTFYGSQLARFLHARLQAQGPLVLPEDGPTVSLRMEGLPYLVVRVQGEAPRGLVFHAVVVGDDEALLGLVTGRLAAGAEAPERIELGTDWPDRARARVALVDSREPVQGEGLSIASTKMHAEVAEFP